MDNSMDSFEEINYLLKLEKEFEELGTKEKKALLNLNLSQKLNVDVITEILIGISEFLPILIFVVSGIK